MSTAAPQAAVTTSTTYTVVSLAGHDLELLTRAEQKFYDTAQRKYLDDNKFTVASDLRALDRLILFETLMYRWSAQLASGRDYDTLLLGPAQEESLRKQMKETAPLIQGLQESLGLTKAARERDTDTVAGYIARLKVAAKEHGIRRERQLGRAIELCMELFSLAGTYKRSNAEERAKIGFESAEDVVDWITDVMRPAFDEVDQHFREHQQKFWIREI